MSVDMLLLSLFVATIKFISASGDLGSCVTDGGYAEINVPCASPCLLFSDPTLPYIGTNTPPANPDPTHVDVSNLTWCSTVPQEDYDVEMPKVRKMWGFCFCTKISTSEPTTFPTLLDVPTSTSSPTISDSEVEIEVQWKGDGAGVGLNDPAAVDANGYQPCELPFTYVDSEGNKAVFDTCLSIEFLPPYIGTGAFPYDFLPLNSETNMSLWCPINSDVYEVDPPLERRTERKNWGFCLRLEVEVKPGGGSSTMSPTPIWSEYEYDNEGNWSEYEGNGTEYEGNGTEYEGNGTEYEYEGNGTEYEGNGTEYEGNGSEYEDENETDGDDGLFPSKNGAISMMFVNNKLNVQMIICMAVSVLLLSSPRNLGF